HRESVMSRPDRFSWWWAAVLMMAMGPVLTACEEVLTPPNANEPPNTTLANIPQENDTLFALTTLHWDGEDVDGLVAGYEYRSITHAAAVRDSELTEWEFTGQTSLTIAFESSDELNLQIVQGRAVDISGGVDATPAERRFYTRRTIFPVTEI